MRHASEVIVVCGPLLCAACGATAQWAPPPAAHSSSAVQGSASLGENPSGRLERIRALRPTAGVIQDFVARHRRVTRESLIARELLVGDLPAPGTATLASEHRSASGQGLLREAKDMLFALLFGGPESGVALERTERELLTVAVPRRSAALGFLQACTEYAGVGTWRDPGHAASDARADNVVLEVEYGETHDELVGDGIITALRLINLLEVNEQILYARMTNVEQSTLVE